jgi:hypothetical protein
MDTWFSIFIFVAILFVYIHLYHQYKKSEDLEIYEMDYTTNKSLQDVCEYKQPILFQIDHFKETESFFRETSLDSISRKTSRDKIDVHLKDIRDYWKTDSESSSVDALPMSFSSVNGLMDSDPKGNFLSESNREIIHEIPEIKKEMREIDDYLAPPYTVHRQHDIMFASRGAYTPMRYHTDSRKFLIVGEGSGIHVKMSPWKSRKYLHPIKDYDNYEFWSPVNVWSSLADLNPKYVGDVEKLKCLEFDVKSGFVLYIPPYWFYSIRFAETSTNQNARSTVTSIDYITPMNSIANIHHYFLYFLQQQNTRYMNFNSVKEVREVRVGEQEDIPSEMESQSSSLQMDSSSNVAAISSSQKQQIDSMLSVITVK